MTVIDIGTNTMLMLIADFDKQTETVKTISDIQKIPRLGKDVDVNKNISSDSIQRAIELLNEYKIISKEHLSESITVTATSFLRDAKNKSDFINKIKSETGIEIEILSGEDEARYSYIGTVFEKIRNPADSRSRNCCIDIGGGSTEIIFGDAASSSLLHFINHANIKGRSIDAGAVRIKEKFFKNHPPSQNQINLAVEFILNLLSHSNKSDESYKYSGLIGVAGTITTLAAIKLGLSKFESEKVNGTVLTFSEIENMFDKLLSLTFDEISAYGDFMLGREDIIISGILILKTFMKKSGFEKINVSAKGLRYGIYLREVFNSSCTSSD